MDEVIADVREKVNKQFPQLDTDFIQMLAGHDRRSDQFARSDRDQAVFRKYGPAEELGAEGGRAIKTIPAVKDVKNGIENTISGPAITFNVDQTVAARAGLHSAGSGTGCQRHFSGRARSDAGGRQQPPVHAARELPASDTRSSLDAIRNTLLVSATGKVATLGTLATVQNDPGQLEIRRENLQRDVAVTGVWKE